MKNWHRGLKKVDENSLDIQLDPYQITYKGQKLPITKEDVINWTGDTQDLILKTYNAILLDIKIDKILN
jgi:hypothetical protein